MHDFRPSCIIVFVATLFLSSCVTYSLVPSGVVSVSTGYTVETRIAWSKSISNGSETWTLDGPGLQSAYFENAIKDGDPLVPTEKGKEFTFKHDMGAIELREFFMNSISTNDLTIVEEKTFEPAKIGTHEGYKSNIVFSFNGDGLLREGLYYLFVDDEKLFVLAYSGVNGVYFEKGADEFEAIVASLRFSS